MTETARASKMTFAIPNGIISVKMGKKSKLDTKTEGNFFGNKAKLTHFKKLEYSSFLKCLSKS